MAPWTQSSCGACKMRSKPQCFDIRRGTICIRWVGFAISDLRGRAEFRRLVDVSRHPQQPRPAGSMTPSWATPNPSTSVPGQRRGYSYVWDEQPNLDRLRGGVVSHLPGLAHGMSSRLAAVAAITPGGVPGSLPSHPGCCGPAEASRDGERLPASHCGGVGYVEIDGLAGRGQAVSLMAIRARSTPPNTATVRFASTSAGGLQRSGERGAASLPAQPMSGENAGSLPVRQPSDPALQVPAWLPVPRQTRTRHLRRHVAGCRDVLAGEAGARTASTKNGKLVHL